MGESDKSPLKQHNDWNGTPVSGGGGGGYGASTSASTLAHANHSWLAPPTHSSFPTYTQPQQPQQRYAPSAAVTSHPVTSGYPALPSYQAWSGFDFGNNNEQQQQQQQQPQQQHRPSQDYTEPTATIHNHCMSAPTTPMTEEEPHMSSYIQGGHQHPYAVSPSYATLTGRRDSTQRDPLHHHSPAEHTFDYMNDRNHFTSSSWDHYHQQPHPDQTDSHSPSSHEEHMFHHQEDDYRKNTSASGMPIFNNNTPPAVAAGYGHYSPHLGDETPSPISNSYPNTDYLSYHDDENPKYARRYSIGGGVITSAPHNTSVPSYPPYMKAYHYKVPLTERPYKCDKCPQSFNRNHDLKRHKRIHLSVKPFPCQTCDKQFSRKDALKRHILVKRCGQPLPPDGRRSSNHQNVSRSTSGVPNQRNKSGPLDLPDQYANAPMAPPY